MGAASPGRWQPWQFFCRTGRTSLWNVTCNGLVAASAATDKKRKDMRDRINGHYFSSYGFLSGLVPAPKIVQASRYPSDMRFKAF